MIRIGRAHVDVAARSHPGRSGKENEDRFAVSAYLVESSNATASLLAVLADGIGGHRAGELAAEIAVNSISHSVENSDGFVPLSTFRQAIQLASQAISVQAKHGTGRLGMGTTCVCAWLIDHRLYTASVGDSRIYLVRDHIIRQLSTDHTWIREAIEKKILGAEQARGNPNAHVLRRYLGTANPPEADLRLRLGNDETDQQAEANQGFLLAAGDRILLCSDGLTDEISDREILAVVDHADPADLTSRSMGKMAGKLIDMANERGGRDNITILLLHVPGKERMLPSFHWMWYALAGGILAVMLFSSFGLVLLALQKMIVR